MVLSRRMFVICSLMFANLVSATVADATSYYVSTTGSDSSPGTLDQPFQTIPQGVSAASGGDTVYVMNGTYPGQQITNPPSGSPDAYTVISNYPGDRPTITNVSGYDRGLYLSQGSANSYIEVRGFEFDGVYDGGKWEGFDNIGYPHHIRFIDNVVHDTVATGLLIFSDPIGVHGGDHLIQGNEFHNIGIGMPGYVPGMNTIYNPGNRTIVEGNTFHNLVHGVGIYQGSDSIHDVTVRGNTFFDIFRPDIDTWQQGSNGGSAVHVSSPGGQHEIYDNIIYRSGSEATFAGISVEYGPNDVKIYNNTFYDLLNPSSYGAIYVDEPTTTNIIQFGNSINGALIQNPEPSTLLLLGSGLLLIAWRTGGHRVRQKSSLAEQQ